MEANPSPLEAWQAYEAGEYELAASIWRALIELAPDDATRRDESDGYLYTLSALARWDEARALLLRLQGETGEARYFHQLGRLETAAGQLQAALQAYDQEARLLRPDTPAALSANHLARGWLQLQAGEARQALAQAEAGLAAARGAGEVDAEAQAHRLLGEIALAQDDRPRARECFADAAVAFAMAGDPAAEQQMADRIAEI